MPGDIFLVMRRDKWITDMSWLSGEMLKVKRWNREQYLLEKMDKICSRIQVK